MKKAKKILAALLAIVILVSCVSTFALAEDPESEGWDLYLAYCMGSRTFVNGNKTLKLTYVDDIPCFEFKASSSSKADVIPFTFYDFEEDKDENIILTGMPECAAEFSVIKFSFNDSLEIISIDVSGFPNNEHGDKTANNGKYTKKLVQIFKDASNKKAYYYDAIYWAVDYGIVNGVSKTEFGTNQGVTRGQFVTMLYRLAGSPNVSGKIKFTDVKKGSYCEKAVLWATQYGITNGVSKTRFGVNDVCNRAQVVTFLARVFGAEDYTGKTNFTDVKKGAYYENAVAWAVDFGVTNGVSKTKFGVNEKCSRAQAVTFLYRLFAATPA